MEMDVLSASYADDTIALYLSNGLSPPVFTKQVIDNTAIEASSVYAIDVMAMETWVLSASAIWFYACRIISMLLV